MKWSTSVACARRIHLNELWAQEQRIKNAWGGGRDAGSGSRKKHVPEFEANAVEVAARDR